MKRICFIGGFSNGGTERATFAVANNLCSEYDVYLLNVDIHKPAFELDDSIRMSYIDKNLSIIKKWIKIYRYLKQNKIDIVVNVEPDIGIFTIPISFMLRKCKYVIWEHGNLFQVHNRFIPFIRRYAVKHFDKYILLTERDRKNFIEKYGYTDKYEVIYNIVMLPAEVDYSIKSKLIISVGHYLPIKNFEIIPDVGRIVFSKHPDWVWEVYGTKDEVIYQNILQKIKRYKLEKNIILNGRTTDMPKVYKKGAIYVLTSLTEGLPMVLLEAKSYKLPIVSFDIETGPDEIIQDGVNGFLVKPYDVNSMAEKICELIENPELRQKMSDNSYIDIDKFSEEKIMNQWKNVLEDLEEE